MPPQTAQMLIKSTLNCDDEVSLKLRNVGEVVLRPGVAELSEEGAINVHIPLARMWMKSSSSCEDVDEVIANCADVDKANPEL